MHTTIRNNSIPSKLVAALLVLSAAQAAHSADIGGFAAVGSGIYPGSLKTVDYAVQIPWNGRGTNPGQIHYSLPYATSAYANTPLKLGILGVDYLVINLNGSVSVANTLYAKEIRVQANPFPDYVFADDYRLMPLDELEASIKRDRHLPGVPAAESIAKDGLPVSEIVVKQMEKIEELTLHAIALKKENAALAERLARIEALLDVKAGK